MSDKLKILLVDDDPDILNSLKQLVEKETPYHVITALDGNEGLVKVSEHATDLICVVSDYKMPGLNGIELRSELLKDYANIPFIILSGYVTREMAMTAVENKISAFIAKPVQEREVLESIAKHSKPRVDEIEERKILEQSFIEESLSIVEELEPLILGLEENPKDIDLLNTIFRLVHTVKGASGVIDNPQITSYLHKYEDLLQKLKSQALAATPEIVTVLLNGFDGMSVLVEAVSSGEKPDFPVEETIATFVAASEGQLGTVVAPTAVQDAAADKEKRAPSKKESTITIQTSLLDEFLEQSGEIMVIRNMINKLVITIEKKLPGDESTQMLVDLLEEMHKINSNMQSLIVDLRKVPMSKIMKTIPRAVRDVARMLGKKVDLEIKGEDLGVDNTIAKVLSESLIHLVRNGVDHGIETPDVRTKAGKPETGTLQISCYIEGEDVVVELCDDGGGINPENIKNKMRKIGYTEDQIRTMPESKIFSMIFDSGFSTAAQVTNVSGRGVGLDMVRSSIEDIGGRIDTSSRFGQGTTFKLILPIPKSVLIISSMLVEDERETFLLPQDDVLRLIQLKEKDVEKMVIHVEGGKLLSLSDRLLPIVSLKKVLTGKEPISQSQAFIVVRTADHGDFAIEVDSILDAEDVVVKKAGKFMTNLGIYKGATFMGDGKIALILDVEGIARMAQFPNESESSYVAKTVTKSSDHRDIVWVDVVRKGEYAIPLGEVFRLEEILLDNTETTSKYRVSLYREKIMPIFSLSNLLIDEDPAILDIEEDKALSIIVFETTRGFVGFEVNAVKDVKNVKWDLKSNVKNSMFLSGAVDSDGQIIHIIDVDSILDQFGFQSLISFKIQEESKESSVDSPPESLPEVSASDKDEGAPVEKEAADSDKIDMSEGWGLF